MDSRRAESFSDGVFAVAITILVFNLLPIADKTTGVGTPTLSVPHLGHYWPAYLAYVVSFLTIGIMWVNHHGLFVRVSRVDRPLLLLNLYLLMGIVAIPFPTALVADHLNNGSQGKVAAVVYGLVMIAISVGYGAVWYYVISHPRALGGRGGLTMRNTATLWFTAGNLGYIAGTLIALVAPVAAVIIFGLLAVYYMFEHLPESPAGEGDDAAEPEGGR